MDGGLYSFIRNRGISRFDANGLRLYVERVLAPVVDIQARFGDDFYAGTTTPSDRGGKTYVGEDEIVGVDGLDAGTSCCALVRQAKEIRVVIWSFRPNDPINIYYTQPGHMELAGHEERRVKIYEKAFREYLEPSELGGFHATRCGIVCAPEKGEAKRKLQRYLDALRVFAEVRFFAYWFTEQKELGLTEKGQESNGLFTGFASHYSIREPEHFAGAPCPGDPGVNY